MKTAIISLSHGDTTEKDTTELTKLGVTVEFRAPQGLIIKGEEKTFSALEAKGYRVKTIPDPEILMLGNYLIDTRKRLPKIDARLEVDKSLEKEWPHHLLQLAGPPSLEWIEQLRNQGVDVVEKISTAGLFVVCLPAQLDTLGKLPFVKWTGIFKPAYRISPNLQGMKGLLEWVSISLYPGNNREEVLHTIKELKGTVKSTEKRDSMYGGSYEIILAELDADHIPIIAALPEVRWIEYQGPDVLTDERSAQIAAGNLNNAAAPNTAPVTGYQDQVVTGLGLNGNGVIIGIVDSGVDTHNNATMQADLAGRMTFFVDTTSGTTTVDRNGHGTHVAGIAVGNAASGDTDPQNFLLGQGVAPGAQFGSINAVGAGGTLSDDDRTRNVVSNGGSVSNNSWGVTNSAGSGYTARSATYDRLSRDPDNSTPEPEHLIIVSAAGNDGNGLNTISAPWEAKNPIIVGNSLNFRPGQGDLDDIRGLRTSSSRGLAIDGRILPTIVAPGTDIVSARSSADANPAVPGTPNRAAYTDTNGVVHNTHTSMSGTSMAAPHVAGLCALLTEWWRNRTGNRNPSMAMVKALLINGAVDIAGGPSRRLDGGGNALPIAPIPNGDQGWGRVNLRNMVLRAPESDRGPKIFVDQRHAFTADNQHYTIRVAPAVMDMPLRISLVWTDAPGGAGANPSLVNDLDLEVVETSTGLVYKGNVFNNGFSVSGGDFDAINNTECVYIQNPAGVYEIRVIAALLQASAHPQITTAWQDFALVIDNAEVPAADPVSVVPVIDRSGSMEYYGYAENTRISSRQFVDLMHIDDNLGIVSFGDSATKEFPLAAGNNLETITGDGTRNNANDRINLINFSGCTYMGAGINQARDMLNTATGTKAMVLLSDGYDNKGCSSDPARPSAMNAASGLPSDISVYTCAMGPASDQSLLEQIATSTGGRYYYMPAIDDLFEIYNYIRGQVSGDSIIVNESAMASSSRVGGFVDALAETATFTVSWADTSLRYVTYDPRKHNEISIRLRAPGGRLIHPHDSAVRTLSGEGYITFRIHDPKPGLWYVEVSTARKTHTRYTVGGFVNSALQLTLPKFAQRIKTGTPLRIGALVFENGKPFSGFRADALVTAPNYDIRSLLKEYRAQLEKLKPGKIPGGDALPEDLARLWQLRQLLIREGKPDIFSTRTQSIRLHTDVLKAPENVKNILDSSVKKIVGSRISGTISGMIAIPDLRAPERLFNVSSLLSTPQNTSGSFNGTYQSGSYNLQINVSGLAPDSQTRFQRKALASVWVE